MLASVEQLVAVEEIGERIAGSVYNYFSKEENRELIERLRAAGVQMEIAAEVLLERTDILKGQSIVISGVFARHSRDEYKAMIEKNG